MLRRKPSDGMDGASRLCSTCVCVSTLNVLETERGLVLNKLVTEQVGGEKQGNKTRLSTVS